MDLEDARLECSRIRPTLEVSRSDFVRMILLEGIATLERDVSGESRTKK